MDGLPEQLAQSCRLLASAWDTATGVHGVADAGAARMASYPFLGVNRYLAVAIRDGGVTMLKGVEARRSGPKVPQVRMGESVRDCPSVAGQRSPGACRKLPPAADGSHIVRVESGRRARFEDTFSVPLNALRLDGRLQPFSPPVQPPGSLPSWPGGPEHGPWPGCLRGTRPCSKSTLSPMRSRSILPCQWST